MVDFAIEEEKAGKSPTDAIREACRPRFRPILMTTVRALLGGLPLMFSSGIGSQIRTPLSFTIVGDLIVSQVLTLFTTPVIYIAIDRLSRAIRRGRAMKRFKSRSKIRLAISLAIVACLAGCRVGPEFQPPETAPRRYVNGPSSPAAAGPRPDWWAAFGSRELDALIAQARRENPNLAVAASRVRQVDAQARIVGAALLPSVDALTNNGPEQQEALQGQRRQHITLNGVLNVSYELNVWGKNRSALDAAQASAARYARAVVDVTITTGVATLYFQVLGLRDRLGVAAANLAHARRTLSDTMAEERQGIVAHQAVLLQEAAVATLETMVPPLQQQLALGSGSLSGLRQPTIKAGQPFELLTRRPDIMEAEENLVAANADIRVARAQFLPSFTFNLNGGINAYRAGKVPVPPGHWRWHRHDPERADQPIGGVRRAGRAGAGAAGLPPGPHRPHQGARRRLAAVRAAGQALPVKIRRWRPARRAGPTTRSTSRGRGSRRAGRRRPSPAGCGRR